PSDGADAGLVAVEGPGPRRAGLHQLQEEAGVVAADGQRLQVAAEGGLAQGEAGAVAADGAEHLALPRQEEAAEAVPVVVGADRVDRLGQQPHQIVAPDAEGEHLRQRVLLRGLRVQGAQGHRCGGALDGEA
ncbi:MAG: hypothetical protein ACK559_03980, partial [bacterium]